MKPKTACTDTDCKSAPARGNAYNWTDYNVQPTLFDRGYTGHEHLDQFGLINMNGRIYDPVLARFLSPDPFVQDPSATQNYNRYTYAMNNPLKYTDPSGYSYKPAYWNVGINGAYYVNQNANSGPTGLIGPGSGNHWSDPYRTENSSWWLGNEASFDSKYGEGAYDSYYNQHYAQQTSENTISNGDVSNNNELSTAWVQLGFFYYDTNGNPIVGKDGTFGQFWVYEASVIDEAQVTGRQLNSNGFKKNDALTYGLFGTSIWANIIYAGFDAAKKIQPTVATWIKGSRLFGRGSNVLSGVMISYDFATGTANTSTLVNAGVTMAGSAVIIFAGAAATPYVIGAGVIYGVISVAGGDEWLNSNFDISDQINFIKP